MHSTRPGVFCRTDLPLQVLPCSGEMSPPKSSPSRAHGFAMGRTELKAPAMFFDFQRPPGWVRIWFWLLFSWPPTGSSRRHPNPHPSSPRSPGGRAGRVPGNPAPSCVYLEGGPCLPACRAPGASGLTPWVSPPARGALVPGVNQASNASCSGLSLELC